MNKKNNRTKIRITIAVFVALLAGIFTAAVTEGRTSPLTNAMSFIISPLQSGATALSEKLSDVRLYFVSSQKYKEEAESLREEIHSYRSEIAGYEKDKLKLEAYEQFLELKDENPDYAFEPANIISRTADDIFGTFTVDKGSADGIEVNDPVIYGETLVGIVTETTADTATVYTLFNPNINVSVYEVRTRLDCILESDSTLTMQGYLKLTGLSGSTPIVQGGIIVTSGVGGKYPSDLLIGTVTEVREDDTSIASYALITPEIDYDSLRDVFILTDFNR